MFDPNLKINAERLFFRYLRMYDANKTYKKWLNDKDVNKFLETRHEIHTIAKIKNFISVQNKSTNNHLFGVFHKKNKIHIGNVKLGPIHKFHPVSELSLFIGDKKYWGNGYGSEIIKTLTYHAFKNLGLKKLSAGAYSQNISSVQAFIKSGYHVEGIRKKHYLLDSKLADITILGCKAQVFLNEV